MNLQEFITSTLISIHDEIGEAANLINSKGTAGSVSPVDGEDTFH
jgi:hypothetical protein